MPMTDLPVTAPPEWGQDLRRDVDAADRLLDDLPQQTYAEGPCLTRAETIAVAQTRMLAAAVTVLAEIARQLEAVVGELQVGE